MKILSIFLQMKINSLNSSNYSNSSTNKAGDFKTTLLLFLLQTNYRSLTNSFQCNILKMGRQLLINNNNNKDQFLSIPKENLCIKEFNSSSNNNNNNKNNSFSLNKFKDKYLNYLLDSIIFFESNVRLHMKFLLLLLLFL